MTSGSEFRESVTNYLRQRPLVTRLGQVISELEATEFGYPGGSHGSVDCWIYHRSGTRLEMLFGFYSNFTPHDLICKVMEVDGQLEPGEGASIQFNSNRCVHLSPSGPLVLRHHGQVTVKRAIARSALVATVRRVALTEWDNLISRKLPWPLEIGSLQDMQELLDDLFMYTYCIEQAKRHLRGLVLLPKIT